MSFWSTSTGDDLSKTETPKEYEAPGGGNMDPIPDGSTVLAFVREAGWDKNEAGDRYIKLRWDVTQPESVARRVIFQKLWVKDPDPNAKNDEAADKKRDNALKMLAAIDANAGGKLAANGGEPTDDQLLIALANKEMAITVKVWSMKASDGSTMEGNWICAVAPKGKELKVPEAKPKPGGVANFDDLGEQIPF